MGFECNSVCRLVNLPWPDVNSNLCRSQSLLPCLQVGTSSLTRTEQSSNELSWRSLRLQRAGYGESFMVTLLLANTSSLPHLCMSFEAAAHRCCQIAHASRRHEPESVPIWQSLYSAMCTTASAGRCRPCVGNLVAHLRYDGGNYTDRAEPFGRKRLAKAAVRILWKQGTRDAS